MTYDIIILTQEKYIHPTKRNDYINNVLYEDELIQKALEAKSLKVKRIAWDDSDFDWSSTKYVLFRAIWDYFERFEEFSKWVENVSQETTLLNSEAIIRWNIDKHYLLDLKQNQINIAETYFIEQGSNETLKDLHAKLDLKETVLKPCISGSARHTYRLNKDTIENHEALFSELIKNESMMLQPFQYNIVEKGEISMMVFSGGFTHAVLKKAKKGDFRVQDDFGGSVIEYFPTEEEIIFAENCLKACPELPIYARVDIFTDNHNQLAVSELELIEPELWFRNYPKAAQILAEAISNLK